MIHSTDTLNSMDEAQARTAFTQCCSATNWVNKMVASRPYKNLEACLQVADLHWAGLAEADYLEAFEGHPKIGDVNSLKKKYANTKVLASGEQSGVNAADQQTIEALAQGNTDYETKNGFIFIVCATGKSAAEMLALLQARLKNTREQEIENAAVEQAKITAIRIEKLLADG